MSAPEAAAAANNHKQVPAKGTIQKKAGGGVSGSGGGGGSGGGVNGGSGGGGPSGRGQRGPRRHACSSCRTGKNRCVRIPGQAKCDHCQNRGYVCVWPA